LVRLGYIDKDTLDNAITKQIIELHSALQESNRTLEMKVSERTIELRNALERLSELNQIKANLISNISHELRTPLAHIRGYIELLADGQIGELSNEQVSALKVVRKATDRLSNLIEELIEFSTASREGLSLQLSVTLVEELFSNVIERSVEKAEAAGVNLNSDPGGDKVAVKVDPDRLSWVIYQLVDNGIKFTPAGGVVTMTAINENATTKISISDTGIGIPEGGLEEIFEPFHQLDGSATRRYGGTGLGLSLVNLILEAHGTTLQVTSEEGQGSTFWFNLPTIA
jgi:signal transduction histidine kinase